MSARIHVVITSNAAHIASAAHAVASVLPQLGGRDRITLLLYGKGITDAHALTLPRVMGRPSAPQSDTLVVTSVADDEYGYGARNAFAPAAEEGVDYVWHLRHRSVVYAGAVAHIKSVIGEDRSAVHVFPAMCEGIVMPRMRTVKSGTIDLVNGVVPAGVAASVQFSGHGASKFYESMELKGVRFAFHDGNVADV